MINGSLQPFNQDYYLITTLLKCDSGIAEIIELRFSIFKKPPPPPQHK